MLACDGLCATALANGFLISTDRFEKSFKIVGHTSGHGECGGFGNEKIGNRSGSFLFRSTFWRKDSVDGHREAREQRARRSTPGTEIAVDFVGLPYEL